jgi:hypothetical protein
MAAIIFALDRLQSFEEERPDPINFFLSLAGSKPALVGGREPHGVCENDSRIQKTEKHSGGHVSVMVTLFFLWEASTVSFHTMSIRRNVRSATSRWMSLPNEASTVIT